MLGIAIGEKSLVIAEAVRAGDAPRITLAASFIYPLDSGLENPAALGEALAAFLKEKGFTARQVVVGVPARWVLSKPKEVPPADPSVIAEALRLQVEGEFTQELRDLSFDYAGDVSPSESRQVLLVALQGKHLEQIKTMIESARLQLSAVTPVGCVLGAATASLAGKPRQAMVVSVGPGGVELAALDGPGTPRVLRHLGASASSPALLAGELRRATFAAGGTPQDTGANGKNSVNGNGNGHGRNGPALILWDASALSEASRRALADAAGTRLEQGDLQTLGVPTGLSAGSAPSGATAEIAGAAALAMAALSEEPLAADFLHSKLAEPRRIGLPPKVMILGGIGIVVLALITWIIVDLATLSSRATTLAGQAESRQKEMVENAEFLKRVRFAEEWHTTEPKFLACIRDLARRMPDNPRDPPIYITDMQIREPAAAPTSSGSSKRPAGALSVSLVGKAPDKERFFTFCIAISDEEKVPFELKEPKYQKANNSEQVTFTVPLIYQADKSVKAPVPAPAPAPATRPTTPSSQRPR
jgi:hypothetical protein